MRAIVLAHEKSFNIGPVVVQPSTRSLARGPRHEILEPRVMQVLVALAGSPGEVVSRDDLVERCWSGRVVGDDAVNRVIARLRRTAEGIGEGVFAIDTITRVGYRLRLLDDAAIGPLGELPGHPPRSRLSRRELVAGGAVAAAAAAGWLLLGRHKPARLSPETVAIMRQAQLQLWQNTREGQNQAIGLYRQVVADNAGYADGWGYLSMAYAWTAHYRQSAEAAMMQSRARSAGEQALALEPHNPLALVGLACARPYLRNWIAVDRGLREAMRVRSGHYEVPFNYSLFLHATGHPTESLNHMKLALPPEPNPAIFYYESQVLWSAGKDEEVDNLLTEASRLYPTHFGIWFSRFYFDMYSGRPDAALAFAADTGSRPTGIDPEEIASVSRVARAMQSRSPVAIDQVVREWMERAHNGAGLAENAAQFMAALGRLDEAFAVLRAYYFSEGFDCGEIRFSSLQGTYTPRRDRLTAFLFLPSLASVRGDRRFADLVARLGLTGYWHESGDPPDYLSTRNLLSAPA